MTPQIAQSLITTHLITIVLLLVLFAFVNIFYRLERKRLAAIIHNALRGMYLLALISGGLSVGITPDFPAIFLKIVTGLLTLIFVEIHLTHTYVVVHENRPTFTFFTYFMIVFTIVLGMVYPAGISIL